MEISLTSVVILCALKVSIADPQCDPIVDAPVKEVTVVKGETAILPCSITNLCDYRVVWLDQWSTLLTLDERRITSDARLSIERSDITDWNLKIMDANYTDQGQYDCLINYNPIRGKTIMLTVLED